MGYTIVANSVPSIRSTTVPPSPFVNQVPHPSLDPRYSDNVAGSRRLVQLSRITITLDDSSQHGLVSVVDSLQVFLAEALGHPIAECSE